MKLLSISRALLKSTLVGPALTFQLVEMAVASVQVVTYRSIGFAKAIKEPKSSDGREFYLMVSEKIDGVRDSVAAGWKHVVRSSLPGFNWLQGVDSIPTSFMLIFSSRNPVEAFTRSISQSFAFSIFAISSLIRIFLSGLFFVKATTRPLHYRVVSNAKRLGKK